MEARESVQLISQDRIEELKERAQRSPRRRVNHNFHPTLDDNPHRFLNVMARGTYVTPHRHLSTPKAESFLVLEGRVAFIVFDDRGRVSACYPLGEGTEPHRWGIDLAPGIWHTVIVLSDTAVIYEVKPGPYVATDDKDLAEWAPREGDPGAQAYLLELEQAALAAIS